MGCPVRKIEINAQKDRHAKTVSVFAHDGDRGCSLGVEMNLGNFGDNRAPTNHWTVMSPDEAYQVAMALMEAADKVRKGSAA